MNRHPVFIENGQKSFGQKSDIETRHEDCPPPEEDLGGGDMCSLEREPPTDDDKPLG